MPDPLHALLLMLLAGAILAVGAGLPVLAIIRSRHKESLFPQRATWSIPWNGWAVLAMFIGLILLPSLMNELLSQSGFFQAFYGPDFPLPATAADQSETTRYASHLRGLWSQTLALPFEISLIIALLKFGTGATFAQMGLSRQRFGANFVVGYLSWLILTPLVFGINLLAIKLAASNPQKHPLMDLGPQAGQVEMITFAVQAALLTPILEELSFRGVLLPWSVQPETAENQMENAIVPPAYRPHVCYAAAMFFGMQTSAFTDAIRAGRRDDILSAIAPVLFLLSLAPAYFLLPFVERFRKWTQLSSPHMAQGWLANGILFAAVHSNVWPSPIPLFFLGLGLAWLAIRTRSIVPSIVLHALFNGVAVVYLVVGGTS